jgi:hypothetical protein
VNRVGAGNTVEAQIIDNTNPPPAYGLAVMIDPVTGQVRPPIAADGATPAIYGIYVRPYPTHATQDALGVDTPPTQGEANVLKRGYIITRLTSGTAVKGGPVGVSLATAVAPDVPGGITANAPGADVVALGSPATTYFMGPADATGIVEIAFNI